MREIFHMSTRVAGLARAILSGILLGIGFVIPFLWPAVFLGVALFIYTVQKSDSVRATFFYSWLSGVALHLCALYAVFWKTMPLDWFGISDPLVQVFAVFGVWFLNACFLGIGVGIGGLLIREYGDGSWRDVFIIPACWVLSEWIGSFIIYAANFGPGSFFGAHFTLGWIGYQLAHNAFLLQAAWFGGIYALSFIATAVGVIVLKIWTSTGRSRRMYIGVSGILMVGVFMGHFTMVSFAESVSTTTENTVKIAVISRYEAPHFTLTEEEDEAMWDRMYFLIKPLRNVDVVLFPENTAFLRALSDDLNRTITEDVFKAMAADGTMPLVIDSEDLRFDDGPIHSRVAYATGSGVSYGYKQFLLPMGEHIPYFYQAFVLILGGSDLLHSFQEVRGYAPGVSGGYGMVRGSMLTTRFCDESMSPELYRAQVRSGANILVDISSLSWFHGSAMVYEQMKLIAKVRATESGRWFVQSGNMSPAFIIDDHGRLVAETKWDDTSVLMHDVPSNTKQTPYIQFGSLVLLIPTMIIAFAIVRNVLRKEHSHGPHA